MHISFERRIKAVIFDLDGVVLDSMRFHVAAWTAAFSEVGLTIDPGTIYLNEGALDRERLCPVFDPEGRGLSPEAFDRVLARQREIYISQYASHVRIFPGAAQLIDDLLNTSVTLALVTSSVRGVLAPEIWTWLEERFAVRITKDMVRRGKPHPEPYLKALSLLGLEPSEAVVIENAPAGIHAAKQAGLTCLALTTTLPAEALAEADEVLPDHQTLAAALAAELAPGSSAVRTAASSRQP